jgi:hypothetical protein
LTVQRIIQHHAFREDCTKFTKRGVLHVDACYAVVADDRMDSILVTDRISQLTKNSIAKKDVQSLGDRYDSFLKD